MDTSNLIIPAIVVVVVIALVVYRFRREFNLTFSGYGTKVTLRAKGAGAADTKDATLPERSVAIGRDAKGNRIVTGDGEPGRKAGAAGARSVSIGRDAVDNTIVTGDGSKTS